MKKRILLLLVVLIGLSSCKNKNAFDISDPALFKAHITSYTSGLISTKNPIQVGLTQPSTQWKFDEELDPKLFSIEPKVKGRAYYLSNNTVSFVPNERLKQDQKYEVTFHLSKATQTPEELQDFRFIVRTIPQDFSVELLDLQTTNTDTYVLNGRLIASDWMLSSQVEEIIRAQTQNSTYPVQVMASKEEEARFFTFTIPNIERKKDSQLLEVNWDGKSQNISRKGQEEIEIPALGDFKAFKVLVNPDNDSNQSFWINFSDPLKRNQNFDGLVSINHTDPIKYSSEGTLLKVFSEVPFNGKLDITVHQGIENNSGQKTTKENHFSLDFEQQKPAVRFIKSGTLLPSSENLKVNFQATNLKAVDVKVYKIFENNILQFLQDNELDGKYSLRKVATPVARTTLTLGEDSAQMLKKWNSYALDLASLIEPDPGAIYRVELSFRKKYALYNCTGTTDAQLDESFDQMQENYFNNDENYYDYSYYNWKEKENPCHYTYYYNRTAATNILATDLGVIAKKGNDNSYLFAVTNLLTTHPVKAATVELYSFQQQLIQKLETNAEGIATSTPEQTAYFALVTKDNHSTYIKLDDGHSLSVSSFDVDGQSLQQGLNGYIYTERGVWRPGDPIFIGFILEDQETRVPEKHPIKITLKDPFGKIIDQQLVSKNPHNHYAFTLHTEKDAPTGNWEAMVSVGGARFYKKIKIETIKPNRLKIINDTEGLLISGNQNRSIHYQIDWLQGAVAKNLKAEVKAKFLAQKTSFEGYNQYSFNNSLTAHFGDEINVFSGNTDETGAFSFSLHTNETPDHTGMLKLLLTTKVYESGGDFSTDVSSATFSPYTQYTGVAIPEGNKYNMLETGSALSFPVVTLTQEGKPYSDRVKVDVYRIDWNWWWSASQYDISSYNASSYHNLYQTGYVSTDSKGKGSFNIQIPDQDWGRYEIVVTNSKGHIASSTFYVDWPIWSGKSAATTGKEATVLAIATDKKEYNLKEKIKVSFPSSEGGRALISIENGAKVVEAHWVETQMGETVFELTATEAMAPNAYIHITSLQPHANTINNAPIRLYGIAPIQVYNAKSKLQPLIHLPQKLEPEQKFDIQVSEKNGMPMTYTLAIVEEGLLDLTRFATPDPWNSFYSKTALGVKTWDIYNDVIGAYGGTIRQIFSIGGDEDLGAGEAKKANRFKPVVIFKGPYTLEKGKKTKHTIKIPNYIGSVRTMLIASNTDLKAYGKAEATTPVTKPLMVLGSMPRRAVTSEKITLPVTVFAMENSIKQVQVRVQTDDKFTISGADTQQILFDEPDEKLAYFDLEVNAKTGISKIVIEASAGSYKASYELELDVMNPNPVSFQYKDLVLEPHQTVETNWKSFGIEGSNQAVLELTTFPGINLNARMNYLIAYPHGCAEQITSGLFPQLYVGELTSLDSQQKESIQRNINAGIQKLLKNQFSDGSFSYWPGSRYYDDWSTSYIGHFFIEAEKKGYAIPSTSMENWKAFQQKAARQWRFENKYRNDLAQAYRLYTLALAGSPDLASMNRLKETQSISNDAKLRLAATYALAGQLNAAKQLALHTELDENYYSYYGSYERNLAMALETLLTLENKTLSHQYAMDLAKRLGSDRWMSTQTTAYSLKAITAYLKQNPSSEGIDASYTLNGKEKKVTTRRSFTEEALKGISKDNKLVFRNLNNSTVFAKVSYSGVLPVGEELSTQNGLSIHSRFRTMAGQTLLPTELQQGTEFVQEITVKNTTNRKVDNIALTQIVPSGWEIVNLRYTALGEDSSAKVDHTDIRDDRTYFYFALAANETKRFRVVLNASYLGRYYLPGVQANAMYDNNYNTRTTGSWVEVIR